MTLFQSIVLGVVQGATEFIPVSSTAHLVLVPWLLGWKFDPQAAFVFDILVQWGTLAALIAYYRRDLWAVLSAMLAALWAGRPFAAREARLGWLLLAATLPAGLIGLGLKRAFEAIYQQPVSVAALLSGTGLLLFASERVGRASQREIESLGWFDAVFIGFAQALAILPGISRSGATIAGGLARGLNRRSAARFSFLMSVPVMLGAGGVALRDLSSATNYVAQIPALAASFLAAAVVGYASIRWLLGYLVRGSLYGFAAYCLVASLASLAVAALR